MPDSRATASGSSPSPAVQRRAQRPSSPRGTFLLCWEERALGQTVFIQCMNEVVARCSLFTGILFIHPGLKHSYEIRTAILAWQMPFEQLGSVRVDGHATVFGCLSQAVSEFPVQVERHVHLNTSLRGRPGGRSWSTPGHLHQATPVDNSPGSDPSTVRRHHCTAPQRMQSTRCERGPPLTVQAKSAGLVRLTAWVAPAGGGRRVCHGAGPARRPAPPSRTARSRPAAAVAPACFRARPRAEPGRVLAGGRGQSRAFGVADLAAVLGGDRGVAADRLALE